MNILKEIRSYKNMTQKELSEYLEIPLNTYKMYELGYRKIPTEIQIKVLKLGPTKKYGKIVNYLSSLLENEKK
ncbi:MAG TPA: helix-turn-helix transcriptional regulator [Spirochaetota bacterium]|nr:helix-turn-helix transcriptional regulator [Spirochaetota bacterium]